MPKITIDGRELTVAEGTSIIRAALSAGIDIPYYCWHPRLSIAANCRMCLVELEKAPKLVPACEVIARDGQVVHTKSEKVLEARKSVMEFLLINHPIDCPICDQAGECKLQDYYMAHDTTGTRFAEVKVQKAKTQELGPMVVLDQERCINCTRCVRFMQEVAHNPQLGQFDRGDRATIGIFPGQPLDDPYSGNVVDLCPVGALTSRDFRFKVRSWFLKHADSVCAGCARGCSVRVDHHDDQVQRLIPRDNEHVNQGWMCDAGRLSYKRYQDAQSIVTKPHLRNEDGKLVPVGWAEARRALAEKLAEYTDDSDGSLALALSSQITTEGATAFVELAEQVLHVDTFAITGLADWEGDQFLRVPDRNPNRAGLELVLESFSIFDDGASGLRKSLQQGTVRSVIFVGSEYAEEGEEWRLALAKAEVVVACASHWDETSRAAHIVLPMASYLEQDGTFVNVDGRTQRVHAALRPFGGRKSCVELSAFLAQSLGAGSDWSLTSWTAAFHALKRRTGLLQGVEPLTIGAFGASLEALERGESKPGVAPPATVAVAG